MIQDSKLQEKPDGTERAFRLPAILGIVNITADSFSDGGRYLAPDAAIDHARSLSRNGADAIDLGAAASNPRAEAVPAEEEIARLAPVVDVLKHDNVSVSIDTFAADVQRWAMSRGVDYLNDIHGFPDERLYPALADSPARLIVMHAVQESGRATAMAVEPSSIFQRILDFFESRIEALSRAGVAHSRLILDPGMGLFLGTRRQASFEVLRRLPELKKAFELPVLISVSRKSFLRDTAKRGISEIGPATLAAELFAVLQGADYIRTHDPGALADGLAVWTAALTGNTTSS